MSHTTRQKVCHSFVNSEEVVWREMTTSIFIGSTTYVKSNCHRWLGNDIARFRRQIFVWLNAFYGWVQQTCSRIEFYDFLEDFHQIRRCHLKKKKRLLLSLDKTVTFRKQITCLKIIFCLIYKIQIPFQYKCLL